MFKIVHYIHKDIFINLIEAVFQIVRMLDSIKINLQELALHLLDVQMVIGVLTQQDNV